MAAPVRIASIDAVDVPAQLYITGITTPAASSPLILSRASDLNGFATWESGVWTMSNDGDYWNLENDGTYFAQKESTEETPAGLDSWTLLSGVGQPVVRSRPAPPVSVVI